MSDGRPVARPGSRLSAGVYAALTSLAEPLAAPALGLLHRRESPELRAERLGRNVYGEVDSWWHAASLGEVAALVPVLREAQARGLSGRVAVTTTSATGRDAARKLWPDRVALAPLDLPRAMARALDARRPRVLILVETELWPHWLRLALDRGIRVAVVNGRLSDRTWARTRRWTPVPRIHFAALCAIAARTEKDAERFLALGARESAVRVTGNTKHDREPASEPAHLPWTRARVWTAGSLRPGEEAAILVAYQALRSRHADLRLVVVPRHPEAWPDLAAEIRGRGWRVAVRSRPESTDPEADVLLVDTRGELTALYAASSAAFVGGSLVPVGGHNVMEAAAAGIPAIVGPHTATVAEEVEELRHAQAIGVARDGKDLTELMEAWCTNPETAALAGRRGREIAARSRGAATRTVDWLVTRGALPAVDVP